MLFLERKVGESIILANGDIVFLILSADRGNVKIGITAPKFVDISRAEKFEKLKEQQQSKSLICAADFKISEHYINGEKVNKR